MFCRREKLKIFLVETLDKFLEMQQLSGVSKSAINVKKLHLIR